MGGEGQEERSMGGRRDRKQALCKNVHFFFFFFLRDALVLSKSAHSE